MFFLYSGSQNLTCITAVSFPTTPAVTLSVSGVQQAQEATGSAASCFVSLSERAGRLYDLLCFCLLCSRYAADGSWAKKHPTRHRLGVHRHQVVGIAEKHRPGHHFGQSWPGSGSDGTFQTRLWINVSEESRSSVCSCLLRRQVLKAKRTHRNWCQSVSIPVPQY